jgi:cellulose synthase operon protein C
MRRLGAARGLLLVGLLAAAALLPGCAGAPGSAATPLAELRSSGAHSSDAERLGRWLLAELLSPGGEAKRAEEARRRLSEHGAEHYLAELALGLDAAWHGRLKEAPGHYVRALALASEEEGIEPRLVAWFAASQASNLSDHVPELWQKARPQVEALIEHPRSIGWRARAQLVQWWLDEMIQRGQAQVDESLGRLGCVTALRLAGPFGSAAPVHLQRSFPPEAPGPWPRRWPVDAASGAAPEVLETSSQGCEVLADGPLPQGVFYAESFLELGQSEDVILAAQGALALWVDDRLVLDREPRRWGVWARFGTRLRLSAGRHRVLARLSEPRTLLRAMHADGTPLVAKASTDASVPYLLAAPELLQDPNDLMHFIAAEGPQAPGGQGAAELDAALRFLVAELMHLEGEDDVASVLLAPLVEPEKSATGPGLANLADWTPGDPILGRTEASDRARLLQEAAVARDPALWRPQLSLSLAKANAGNLAEAVAPLRALTQRFPDVPAIWNALGAVYGRLGWKPEQAAVTLELGKRFSDPAGLVAAANVYEQRGESETALGLVQRAASLDAGSEVLLERSLRRRDYAAALAELDRLEAARPHRRNEWRRRRQEVKLASGDRAARDALLSSAVEEHPESGAARLALADALLGAGNAAALHQGLAQAIQAGSDTGPLERAIDAVEARSDFAPLRLDGRQVIRDYERAGKNQSASAERVLDYAAVWVHSDGSSRMLEHEIVRVQSEEAISKFAEQRPLGGLVLNMRVIKRDGRTLEPEQVAGKPTVTFPHLELGDYIETEHVVGAPAEERGRTYTGMRWFFREEDVAYARSEFVLIAPDPRPLEIEITGQVPEPELTRDGLFVTRRWRVDRSPAAPVEPLSVPVQEFLPSVRVGWGNGLERRLRLLSEQVADTLPVDPRVRQLAREVTAASAGDSPMERARKAYRWVQDNVKDGQEVEGPKVLTSKQGNRWSALRTLLRALDIPVSYAVVKNRLAPRAPGPMSEAEAYNVPLLRVGDGDGATWLTLQERFAPFGYVPVEARGMPGHELSVEGQRPVVVPAIGDQDRLEYDGSVELAENGSARITLRQSFVGKYAMRLRAGLEQVPEGRLREVVESRLLGQALPGAELLDYSIEAQDDVDAPLVVEMRAGVGKFAEARGDQLVIEPPLMPRLSRLSTLPARQTPLLIGESMHQSTRLVLKLAPGTRVWGTQEAELSHGEHKVQSRDKLSGQTLVLDREVSIVAGRVAPEDYPAFAAFTRDAERVLSQPIVLRVEAGASPAGKAAP